MKKPLRIGFIIGTITKEMVVQSGIPRNSAQVFVTLLTQYLLDTFAKEKKFSISYFKTRPPFDTAEMLHAHSHYFDIHSSKRKPILKLFTQIEPAPLFPKNSEYDFDQNVLYATTVELNSQKLLDLFLKNIDALIIIGGSNETNDHIADYKYVVKIAREKKLYVYRPSFFGEPLDNFFIQNTLGMKNGLNVSQKVLLSMTYDMSLAKGFILKGIFSLSQT